MSDRRLNQLWQPESLLLRPVFGLTAVVVLFFEVEVRCVFGSIDYKKRSGVHIVHISAFLTMK